MADSNGQDQKTPLAPLAAWVRLNVGGTIFATTVTTLAKDPDSFLHRICRTDDNLDSHKVIILHISGSSVKRSYSSFSVK